MYSKNSLVDDDRFKEIVEKYNRGKIIEDEKGAGGFWDWALEIGKDLGIDIDGVDRIYTQMKCVANKGYIFPRTYL